MMIAFLDFIYKIIYIYYEHNYFYQEHVLIDNTE